VEIGGGGGTWGRGIGKEGMGRVRGERTDKAPGRGGGGRWEERGKGGDGGRWQGRGGGIGGRISEGGVK